MSALLVVASCRSIPSEIRKEHDMVMAESTAALDIASDTLMKLETASNELNDAYVSATFLSWKQHYTAVLEARKVILNYLGSNKTDSDLVPGYNTGTQLIIDMHNGFIQINLYWQLMLKDENAPKRAEFITAFRRDITRYRLLQRKFDEWIKQFKVKE